MQKSCSMQGNKPCFWFHKRKQVCHSELGNNAYCFEETTFTLLHLKVIRPMGNYFSHIHQKYTVRNVVIRMITKNKTLPHKLIARTCCYGKVYQRQTVPITFITDELLGFIVCITERLYADRQADGESETETDRPVE